MLPVEVCMACAEYHCVLVTVIGGGDFLHVASVPGHGREREWKRGFHLLQQ